MKTYEAIFNKETSDVKSLSLTSKPLFGEFIKVTEE